MRSVQRGYQTDRARAIAVQCLVRKRSAKGEFKRRKKEKGDVDALQAKIKAYEVRAAAGTLLWLLLLLFLAGRRVFVFLLNIKQFVCFVN